MKAPDISNLVPAKPVVVLPPMPTVTSMPTPPIPIVSQQQQTQNKVGLTPIPPPIPSLAKSNSKK
jgi:hypothetical protein